jgi:hypothetical protein
MEFIDILMAQLADPFRIGLLVALLFTAQNTSGALNRWLPIGLGLVFVAVIIPTAMASDGTPVAAEIGVGVVANAAVLAVMLAAQAIVERARK